MIWGIFHFLEKLQRKIQKKIFQKSNVLTHVSSINLKGKVSDSKYMHRIDCSSTLAITSLMTIDKTEKKWL